jgi:hypothetical protein
LDCKPSQFPIKALVDAWNSSSLKINQEYQRGASWKPWQMQGLVDSVFRRYPIPPLFLHEITDKGLGGSPQTRYEIVDGQQRIRSLADYFGDKFPLLDPQDKRLRLPNSLRSIPALWAKRRYSELDKSQRAYLDTTKFDVYLIQNVSDPDEVRDLFIRLQSGTALSRQQVRDAWPGTVGPFVEMLAGKMDRAPDVHLFRLVDKRGQRNDDDDRDKHDSDRQFCAQLLCLFLAHERDPLSQQSIGPDELDKVYHENTRFDVSGPSAVAFKSSLQITTKIVDEAIRHSGQSKKKFRKLDILGLFLVVCDLARTATFKFDKTFQQAAAEQLVGATISPSNTGKSTSGPKIFSHYEEWRNLLVSKAGIRLDPKRFFDDSDRSRIRQRDNGRCGICGDAVDEDHAEYDHFPVPHASGGRTVIENGRLVCSRCHPRGIAAGKVAEKNSKS